ncbi:winged helix-turn-helix transcriptional regulator [Candidatus Woesearchaeota archaeon]|nr:winged helix-turn-helix transcriptional regulator [Candidatus Woesearchaeota archaeon]
MEKGLNDVEKRILKYLYTYKTSFPVNYIAQKTGLSWATVNSYVEKLEEEGYIIYEKRLGKDMYKFNFDRWKELREQFKNKPK